MKRIITSLLEYLRFIKPEEKEFDPKWVESLPLLYERIGYRFKNISLLRAALTHNSYLRKVERENSGYISPFERMEFLGDSILGLIVAEELFQRFPRKQEGSLSKLKAKIVCEKFLALRANQIELGNWLIMSEDESRSGGRKRKSIVSDAMESLMCAIYLDANLSAVRRFVKKVILVNFEKELEKADITNYKSRLQEHIQGLYQHPPTYLQVAEEGPDHAKQFEMQVIVNGKVIGTGVGNNKKEAQQNAARDACATLELE